MGDLTVAWGWAEPPGELSLVVDPARPELIAEVIAWFDGLGGQGEHTCLVLETESDMLSALMHAGLSPDPDRPFFRYHSMSLSKIAEPFLPDGFRLRHVGPGEAAARAAVHRAGWSDFGSRVSRESYADVMAAWPYRPDLDWVVLTPDARWWRPLSAGSTTKTGRASSSPSAAPGRTDDRDSLEPSAWLACEPCERREPRRGASTHVATATRCPGCSIEAWASGPPGEPSPTPARAGPRCGTGRSPLSCR